MNISKKKNQLKAPGLTDTPFPTKGPTVFGAQYVSKFEQYLGGQLTEKEIIDFKNVLLTQKSTKKNKQNCRVTLSKLSSRQTLILNNAEIDQQARVDHFQKIKDLINRRISRKIQMKGNGLSMFPFANKLMNNFEYIAEDYKLKILNHDLISQETDHHYFEHKTPLLYHRNKEFALLRQNDMKKILIRGSQRDKLNSILKVKKPQSPTALSPYTKEVIRSFSNQYLEQFSQSNKSLHQPISNQIKNKQIQLRADKILEERLQSYLNMQDQDEELLKNKQKKQEFLSKISNLDNLENLKYDFSEDNHTIKTRTHDHSKSSFNITNRNSNRSKNSSLHCHQNYFRKDQPKQMKVEEHLANDDSYVSQTETHLDQLYSQSKYLQKRVLNEDEGNLNKLMKNFVKIEDIKNKIQIINLKKLDLSQK